MGAVVDIQERRKRIELLTTDQILEELDPIEWLSSDLLLAPGRSAVIGAFGGTKKSWFAMGLALCVATGVPFLGRSTRCAPVAWLDYEMGSRATRRRLQRLLRGLGLGREEIADRFRLASLPHLRLTSDGAEDELCRIAEGAGLLVIDSLRASCTGIDENTTEIREPLDMLSRVSERTGVTPLVLHHSPKNETDDPRMMFRGSSAIYDATGCGIYLAPVDPREPHGAVKVVNNKPPADAGRPEFRTFAFELQDIDDGSHDGGIVLVETDIEPPLSEKDQELEERVLTALELRSGSKKSELAKSIQGRNQDIYKAIDRLTKRGTFPRARIVRVGEGQTATQYVHLESGDD